MAHPAPGRINLDVNSSRGWKLIDADSLKSAKKTLTESFWNALIRSRDFARHNYIFEILVGVLEQYLRRKQAVVRRFMNDNNLTITALKILFLHYRVPFARNI